LALAETIAFLQPYVYFALSDPPVMPISPTHVAAGYPLCNPLFSAAMFFLSKSIFVGATIMVPQQQLSQFYMFYAA
jgi:hypothetical protein